VGPGEVGAVERGSLQVGPQLGAAVEVRLPQDGAAGLERREDGIAQVGLLE
jgi:hypothetical protein